MKLAWICGLVLLPLVARADVVQLANGQTVKGRILAYWNGTFELADDGGQISKHPVAAVKRIEFNGGTVVVDTRTRGRLEGTIATYENAGFTIRTAAGKTEQVPATFVTEVSFSGGGGGGQGGSSGGAAPAAVAGDGGGGGGGGGSARKIDTITHGARVDVAKSLARGQVTIVDFYADWCGPCRSISPALERFAKEDHDVVLRKVDIVRWGSPVAQQYRINSIPHIEVYNRQAKLVGTVIRADPDQVQQLIKQAKNGGQ